MTTARPIRLLALLLWGATSAGMAQAQAIQQFDVGNWQVYGTTPLFGRDAAVPGGGVVEAAPRTVPGEIWSSGATMIVPLSLKAGERVGAVFWARAAQPDRVTVTIQGGAPTYASLALDRIDLTPRWRRYTIGGVAPADLAAGSQFLTVQLGRAGAVTSLGPVAFLRGAVDAAKVERAFEGFEPAQVAQDVRIVSDPGVVLAGTLRTPTGSGPGPFPLAILIQGHGPNGGFAVLMKRLLADGIATLEYDKRGIGASTGTYEEDTERLTRDAAAAVAAMRQRPEIDDARIALVGHSQGGAIGPAVAGADPRIAALVTIAGPVGDGLGLFRRSMGEQLVAAGHAQATVTPLVDASAALIQARVGGGNAAAIESRRAAVIAGFVANGFTPDQASGAIAAFDRKEVYGIAQVHTASDLRSLRIPVLALFGSLDPLVVAPGNAAAARDALAHNPAGKVVVLEGLSHWFQDGATTGAEAEVAALGPNFGSSRAVTLVGDWLRDVLTPVGNEPKKPPVEVHD